jgi:hypothetical protein
VGRAVEVVAGVDVGVQKGRRHGGTKARSGFGGVHEGEDMAWEAEGKGDRGYVRESARRCGRCG